MKARIHSFLNTPIKGLSVIFVTQVIDLYSFLPGQFLHDHRVIDHLFMGE
jgi:hypothetical protein